MKNLNKRGNFGSLLLNPWLYVVLIGMAISGIGMRTLKKVNLNKNKIYVISAIGLLFAFGIVSLAMLGIGGTGSLIGGSGVIIDRIQTTTAYTLDNDTTGVNVADSGTDDTRQSIFYLTEPTANGDALIEAGIFTVTRKGDLIPASCEVRVIKPASYDIADTTYRIVTQDVDTGVMNAYVSTDTNAVATTSDPKETSQLAFAEGVATGYVSFLIEIDETGVDPMTQYAEKHIQTSICGYPYTFTIVKADA